MPHHDLVDHKIQEFWLESKKLAPAAPDTFTEIILIEPDHNDILALPINIAVTTDAFAWEHSLTIHEPYIRNVFPDARVTYVAIRSDADMTDIEKAVKTLRNRGMGAKVEENSEQNMSLEDGDAVHNITAATLVVASVDFSHYLPLTEARKKDAESIHAMQNFDYETMLTFGSEHMDSEQSIILMNELLGARNFLEPRENPRSAGNKLLGAWDHLLLVRQKLIGASEEISGPGDGFAYDIRWQGNSAEFRDQNQNVTTSYVVAFLRQR